VCWEGRVEENLAKVISLFFLFWEGVEDKKGEDMVGGWGERGGLGGMGEALLGGLLWEGRSKRPLLHNSKPKFTTAVVWLGGFWLPQKWVGLPKALNVFEWVTTDAA